MNAWSRICDWFIGKPAPVRQYPYIQAAPAVEPVPLVFVPPVVEPSSASASASGGPINAFYAPVATAVAKPEPEPTKPPAPKARARTSTKVVPLPKPKSGKRRR